MTERNNPHIPEPQGTLAGMPYDWRPPTAQRMRARWWNPNDPRLFTPKAFGWGWDLNLYRVLHPRGGKAEAGR
ncbi:DUF5808 domain-containing protein [Nocardia higoensis]|uniref:DUF5808 domain-containing protein n=1 Tax=Nocardia higoensis TaxID=228599 RepID=UPI00031A63D3|nr:DUF5808 domain-containing protein [Nocardia higoensis]